MKMQLRKAVGLMRTPESKKKRFGAFRFNNLKNRTLCEMGEIHNRKSAVNYKRTFFRKGTEKLS